MGFFNRRECKITDADLIKLIKENISTTITLKDLSNGTECFISGSETSKTINQNNIIV